MRRRKRIFHLFNVAQHTHKEYLIVWRFFRYRILPVNRTFWCSSTTTTKKSYVGAQIQSHVYVWERNPYDRINNSDCTQYTTKRTKFSLFHLYVFFFLFFLSFALCSYIIMCFLLILWCFFEMNFFPIYLFFPGKGGKLIIEADQCFSPILLSF